MFTSHKKHRDNRPLYGPDDWSGYGSTIDDDLFEQAKSISENITSQESEPRTVKALIPERARPVNLTHWKIVGAGNFKGEYVFVEGDVTKYLKPGTPVRIVEPNIFTSIVDVTYSHTSQINLSPSISIRYGEIDGTKKGDTLCITGTDQSGIPLGDVRVKVKGSGHYLHEDILDSNIIKGCNLSSKNNYTLFLFERLSDFSYRIQVKGTGHYLHENGLEDKIVRGSSYGENDAFTHFFLEDIGDNTFRIRSKGSQHYLHENGLHDQIIRGTNFSVKDQYTRFIIEEATIKKVNKHALSLVAAPIPRIQKFLGKAIPTIVEDNSEGLIKMEEGLLGRNSSRSRPNKIRQSSSSSDLSEDHQHSSEEVHKFLKLLGQAFMSVRLPMHVIEFFLVGIGKRYDVKIEFSLQGDVMICSFDNGFMAPCYLVNAISPSFSISKMVDICITATDVILEKKKIEDGYFDIITILNGKNIYPRYLFIPANGLMAACYCILFGGGLWEIISSLVIGLLIAAITTIASKEMARMEALVIAFIASISACFWNRFLLPINLMQVILGAIVWWLPGMGLTLGLTDLTTGFPIAGFSKILSALMCAGWLGIGLGAALALNHGTKLSDIDLDPVHPSPDWLSHIAVLVAVIPTCILTQTKLNHYLQLYVATAIAKYGSDYAGNVLGVFGAAFGAFCLGIFSNVYGRLTPFISMETFMFAIIMIVPGSISLKAMIVGGGADMNASIGFLGQMLAITVGIVTGLFVANILVPSFRSGS